MCAVVTLRKQENITTFEAEGTEVPATAATDISRGGSYVTLPAGQEVPPQPKGSYVSLPGALPANGSKVQGTYVTLPVAPGGGD
ncbi:hypothetical protein QF050_001105 [Arthrobacter sp. SLBN-112]|nr:hypothetical protein [Arthrobacter sp. SLBN-112]